MLVNKKLVKSNKYFAIAQTDTIIRFRINDITRFQSQMNTFGFKEDDKTGSCILPKSFNRYAQKNAEPFFVVNKKMPKEIYYPPIFWTRSEWAGRYDRRDVTELIYVKKKRYHREYFLPYSVCFTLNREETNIISDGISYTVENENKLKNTLNMLLGLFGECEILFDAEIPRQKKVRLNWEILPQGNYPWDRVAGLIDALTEKCKQTQKQLMIRDCKAIYDKSPDFIATGRSGFSGYMVFGFTQKNIYVLESIYPNNATYIVQNDWENISKLTKADILANNLHRARIIHSPSWENQFNKIMEE